MHYGVFFLHLLSSIKTIPSKLYIDFISLLFVALKVCMCKLFWLYFHHLIKFRLFHSLSCLCFSTSAQIDEIYVPPDQPETLQPAQSIRHETKVKANDIYLLQNERTIEQSNFNGNNNLENRNDRSNYEFTKMIANGILAAEALEKSIANNKSLLNNIGSTNPVDPVIGGSANAAQPIHHGQHYDRPFPNGFHPNATRSIGNEPIIPMWLTPPRTIPADRPFRYENRGEIPPVRSVPQRERNHSVPYILPNHPQPQIPPIINSNSNNRFKNIYNGPMIKLNHERQKVTKISMPPIRRDYIANVKPVPQFPVQNQPWSLQKHIVAMRGGPAALPPPSHYLPKQKFSGPIKISKKEFAMPAQNVGFQPDSVVVESGFTPIMRRAHTNENSDSDDDTDATVKRHHSESSEEDDYPEQTQRRSDRTDLTEDNTESEENSELLIKTFEPMFIPSPLDSTSAVSTVKTPNKRLTDDLQYMEVEDGDDKMPMAGERHAYYLPPDNNNGGNGNGNGNKVKSTKLYPAGVVVTYDGRTVLDKSLLDSEPYFPTPKRSSSTEQLLHGPAFGPFHGEIPPLSPELMKPNVVRSQ